MIYFGCGNDGAGHYHHSPGMNRLWRNEGVPKLLHNIDGGYYLAAASNGVALLTHEDAKTILGFSDNSVDSRPGSHSTFVADGIHAFNDMLGMAMAAFPEVFARFKFDVVEHEKAPL